METNTTLKIILIIVSCIILIILLGVLIGVFAFGCSKGYTSSNSGKCDICAPGYHKENDDCLSGQCSVEGTFYTQSDRACVCKPKFVGGMCDECVTGYEGTKCDRYGYISKKYPLGGAPKVFIDYSSTLFVKIGPFFGLFCPFGTFLFLFGSLLSSPI